MLSYNNNTNNNSEYSFVLDHVPEFTMDFNGKLFYFPYNLPTDLSSSLLIIVSI